MIKIPVKYSNEVWKCSLDISAWVVGGVVASTASVVVMSGDIIVNQVSLANATTVTFRVSGGTSGRNNQFRIVCTMLDGQIFSEEFSIFIA